MRDLEIEDKMLVLRVRRDLLQGEFAAGLGREWLQDMSMVSDINFGAIARRLRRNQATVRTRLTSRGALPISQLSEISRRQERVISELDELARQYAGFLSTAATVGDEGMAVSQRFAKARRTIAQLGQRRQQLQTTIEAPKESDAALDAERDANVDSDADLDASPQLSLSEVVRGAQQLWERITPAAPSVNATRRRPLDEEARALRISREEMDRLQVGLEQLRLGQEARSEVLSENSRRFLLDEMVNARQSVSKMQTDLVVKLLGVNLQRAHAYLDDELSQAIDSASSQAANDQLISYAQSFLQLSRRYEGTRREIGQGRLCCTDAPVLDLERDVQDFLLVLGLTSANVDAVEWDLSRTQGALKLNVDKLGAGVEFYARGVRLLWQDTLFSLGLLSQAMGGQTLSEREARILQRTARDILTFIPFVIILIIPLSPPGHVLVFSLIQRIFPDFFPSAFSEGRQRLIDTYERLASATPPNVTSSAGAASQADDQRAERAS